MSKQMVDERSLVRVMDAFAKQSKGFWWFNADYVERVDGKYIKTCAFAFGRGMTQRNVSTLSQILEKTGFRFVQYYDDDMRPVALVFDVTQADIARELFDGCQSKTNNKPNTYIMKLISTKENSR